MTWEGKTNEQVLADWDTGNLVWSCDMSGMGPGYEQCIQIMAFEMLRAMLGKQVDWARCDSDKDYWRSIRDEIDADPVVKEAVKALGPSGAQFGAAMNIASVFARHGYSKGMEMVPKSRRIMARARFPTLPQRLSGAPSVQVAEPARK